MRSDDFVGILDFLTEYGREMEFRMIPESLREELLRDAHALLFKQRLATVQVQLELDPGEEGGRDEDAIQE